VQAAAELRAGDMPLLLPRLAAAVRSASRADLRFASARNRIIPITCDIGIDKPFPLWLMEA
jgi:hypothetical protein